MQIDFGKTADDYSRFRAGFPAELYVRLARFGIGLPGQRLLDLGTGTGALAREFARLGLRVTALDRARPMLIAASRLAREGGAPIDCFAARAEALPLADDSFDVVTAGQCWHWFDRTRAADEARRVLRPGGQLALCHFDWLPLPGNVVEATERLVERHNPQWGMGGGLGLYPQWLLDVRVAGFTDVELFSFDVDAPYSHEAWRGRMRASSGVSASLPPEGVAAFDRDLADLMRRDYPRDPLGVAHRVSATVCRKP